MQSTVYVLFSPTIHHPQRGVGTKKKRDFSRDPASSPTYSNKEKYDLYKTHIFIILRTTCPCAGVMATFERENEWQTQNRSYRLDKCVITEAHAVVKKQKEEAYKC